MGVRDPMIVPKFGVKEREGAFGGLARAFGGLTGASENEDLVQVTSIRMRMR